MQAAPTVGPVSASEADSAEPIAESADACTEKVAVVLYDRPQHAPPAAARQAGPAGRAPVEPIEDAHPILTLSLDQPRACQVYQAIEAMSAAAYAANFDSDDEPAAPAGIMRTALDRDSGDGARRNAPSPAIDAPPAPEFALFSGAIQVAGGFVLPESVLRPRTAMGRSVSPTMPLASSGAPGPFSRLLLGGAGPNGAPPPPAGSTGPAPVSGLPGASGDPTSVPEPETWLLTILGLFGLGAAVRRRRARSAGNCHLGCGGLARREPGGAALPPQFPRNPAPGRRCGRAMGTFG